MPPVLTHPVPATPIVPVRGGTAFPVRRVYCIGKNYADHVKEMGGTPGTSSPVFFTKPADGVIVPDAAAPTVPYPPRTQNLHYEGELVLALGKGGRNVSADDALDLIFGVALGCDLTRRDLQHAMKDQGAPWDIAKAFDNSAVMGPITPGPLNPAQEFTLLLNGQAKQHATVSDMIYGPGQILAELSTYFELKQGDLVFTGTPEGVGALSPGDDIRITGACLAPLHFEIAAG